MNEVGILFSQIPIHIDYKSMLLQKENIFLKQKVQLLKLQLHHQTQLNKNYVQNMGWQQLSGGFQGKLPQIQNQLSKIQKLYQTASIVLLLNKQTYQEELAELKDILRNYQQKIYHLRLALLEKQTHIQQMQMNDRFKNFKYLQNPVPLKTTKQSLQYIQQRKQYLLIIQKLKKQIANLESRLHHKIQNYQKQPISQINSAVSLNKFQKSVEKQIQQPKQRPFIFQKKQGVILSIKSSICSYLTCKKQNSLIEQLKDLFAQNQILKTKNAKLKRQLSNYKHQKVHIQSKNLEQSFNQSIQTNQLKKPSKSIQTNPTILGKFVNLEREDQIQESFFCQFAKQELSISIIQSSGKDTLFKDEEGLQIQL